MPPEIRNNIYTLALREPHTIDIKHAPRVPGLLHTNRQLRHEALAIWLLDNRFRITIRRFDGHLCASWNALVHGMTVSLSGGAGILTPRVYFLAERSHNWNNLLHWCRWAYETESHVEWVSACIIPASLLSGIPWTRAAWAPLRSPRRHDAPGMLHHVLPSQIPNSECPSND